MSKLVQIWGAIKPSVTILDGVLAMEGRAGAGSIHFQALRRMPALYAAGKYGVIERGDDSTMLGCIRCYCCIEVCPQAALSTRETFTGKIIRDIKKDRVIPACPFNSLARIYRSRP